jgi:hypothetical protein
MAAPLPTQSQVGPTTTAIRSKIRCPQCRVPPLYQVEEEVNTELYQVEEDVDAEGERYDWVCPLCDVHFHFCPDANYQLVGFGVADQPETWNGSCEYCDRLPVGGQ